MRRLLLEPGAVREGPVTIAGDAFHHAFRVLRLRAGATIELCDGEGGLWEARVVRVEARRAMVEAGRRRQALVDAHPHVALVLGLARGGRTELAIQKATEIGVSLILPAVCARSVARPTDLERKRRRWLEVARQAVRQSERAWVPRLHPPLPLAEALEAAPADGPRLLAHPGGGSLRRLASTGAWGRAPAVTIAVGPEGGFDDVEVEGARALGYEVVSLGPGVLRAETAAIVAPALVALLAGRLDPAPPRDHQAR